MRASHQPEPVSDRSPDFEIVLAETSKASPIPK
jgi:hypothetical protein